MEFHSGMMSPSWLWISITIQMNQRAPPAEPFMAAEFHSYVIGAGLRARDFSGGKRCDIIRDLAED
jgi:hypothetical protein